MCVQIHVGTYQKFLDVTLSSLVGKYHRSVPYIFFYPENEGNTFLGKVGTTKLYGITFHKSVIYIFTDVRTSDVA
jgi:hypothetical protein